MIIIIVVITINILQREDYKNLIKPNLITSMYYINIIAKYNIRDPFIIIILEKKVWIMN